MVASPGIYNHEWNRHNWTASILPAQYGFIQSLDGNNPHTKDVYGAQSILVDEDGIGVGVVYHLKGIKGFQANHRPFDNPITEKPENFENLKASMRLYLDWWGCASIVGLLPTP